MKKFSDIKKTRTLFQRNGGITPEFYCTYLGTVRFTTVQCHIRESIHILVNFTYQSISSEARLTLWRERQKKTSKRKNENSLTNCHIHTLGARGFYAQLTSRLVSYCCHARCASRVTRVLHARRKTFGTQDITFSMETSEYDKT